MCQHFRSDGVRQIIRLKLGAKFCPLFAESMMEPFLRYLYTYVSVSGPHLGYLYSSNSLFNSGLWLLKKLKGTQCIHQLTFTDDQDIQNTFIYKLCKVRTVSFGIKYSVGNYMSKICRIILLEIMNLMFVH